MSLSLIENKEDEKYFVKLQIHEINVVKNMNIPLPYGICFSLNNKQEKFLEPINNENEIFDNNKKIFVFYLGNNHLNDINAIEKEIIINSYTTSIFILKKNFASIKIPIHLNQDSNQNRKWYFLKDINNNICIKILISIYINIPKIITTKENKYEITNSILFKINETIKENKIKNISRSNTNYILNNHNTHLISTNYNSSQGNSLLNLTNNIYNINNNNLNITFPINFSPITLIGKSNSFFIDSKNKQMENNIKIINNNLLFKKNLKPKNESNSLKDSEDSLIINDNAFIDEENNNYEEKNIESTINKLIKLKQKEIEKKETILSFDKEKYTKNYDDNIKNEQIFNMDNKQYIKQTINIEKAKEKNRKQLNLIENINSLYKDKYKQEIQNELNNYEKFIFQSLNNITNINNNLEQILMNKNLIQNEKNKHKEIITPKKAESFNKINIYGQKYSKNKKGILCQNKTIPHNPMYIKKLNFINKKGKIENYINSGRLLNNKKYTPINYKFKSFNRKLSTSTSNISISENIKNESKNKILKTEGKINTNTKGLNNERNNNIKFKKIDKINIKRKSLKIGNIQIPFNQISNKKKFQSRSNYQTKYSFAKINLNKEILSTKTNSTITNNKKNLDKTMDKNTILKSKKIERDINLTDHSNYFHKISNISLDKNIFAIENISPNNSKINKTTFNNNFGKKKLKLLDKSNINNNNKKNLNIDNFKVFNSHNNKGNPLFIKSNNNKQNLTIKNNTFRLNTNPNESNKKKSIKFRNYLNLSGNILLLNIQKPNKSTRGNKKKISS